MGIFSHKSNYFHAWLKICTHQTGNFVKVIVKVFAHSSFGIEDLSRVSLQMNNSLKQRKCRLQLNGKSYNEATAGINSIFSKWNGWNNVFELNENLFDTDYSFSIKRTLTCVVCSVSVKIHKTSTVSKIAIQFLGLTMHSICKSKLNFTNYKYDFENSQKKTIRIQNKCWLELTFALRVHRFIQSALFFASSSSKWTTQQVKSH